MVPLTYFKDLPKIKNFEFLVIKQITYQISVLIYKMFSKKYCKKRNRQTESIRKSCTLTALIKIINSTKENVN